jgi:mRNA interferase RelE/StbE
LTKSNKKPAAKTSPQKPKHKYKLKFVPSAWEEWQALDGSVKEPLRQALEKRLDNPHVPGSALKGELAGYYKIKPKIQGYRLVYGVEDDSLVVMVMAVDKREDSIVYRSSLSRITEKVAKKMASTVKKDLNKK